MWFSIMLFILIFTSFGKCKRYSSKLYYLQLLLNAFMSQREYQIQIKVRVKKGKASSTQHTQYPFICIYISIIYV